MVNELTMKDIGQYMENQYDPKRFVIRERFKFWSSMQHKPGETIPELAARIRQDATTCDFASIKDPQDEAMRTRFICSVDNEAILKTLFRMSDDDLTFSKAVEVAMETEDAAKVAKETVHGSKASTTTPVLKLKRTSPTRNGGMKPQTPFPKGMCPRCGRTGHVAKNCRFINNICRFCQKKGHLEAVCLKKRNKGSVNHHTSKLPVPVVRSISSDDPVMQQLQFDGKIFAFEVDSRAKDNFCTTGIWSSLGKPTLHPAQVRYVSATGNDLPVLGTFTVKASLGDSTTRDTDITFNVSTLLCLNLLGRTAIRKLDIDVRALMCEAGPKTPSNDVHVVLDNKSPDHVFQKACQKVCKEFPSLFLPELGCLKDFELEVAFKPDTQPIFCKPRTVPFAVLEDLNTAYDAGIRKGVWIPTQLNESGTPVVPVVKTTSPGQQRKKLWVCGDYSVTGYQHLQTHRHPIPLPEDLMHKLGRDYYFTKIDLADAYSQIKLRPKSQKKLALITHLGVLLQTRLPFGISSAPGYFQEIMDQLTSDLRGVAVYLDDILVSGSNAEEHLQNLRALLQRLQDKGLRCNLEKCIFAQPSVDYLEPLTCPTRKGTPWKWGNEEQTAFQHLRDILCMDAVLAHFDPNLQIGISCDASEVGIGAVLFHRYADGAERPTTNASKTLTDTQRRYSQIQREALAVVYGLQKFHQFIYGRNFILVTDHKSLVSLFSPTKGTPALAANRIARWALTLSQYDYTIEYRKTGNMGTRTLSAVFLLAKTPILTGRSK
ncbi:uncharacterized protein K02A2.6-like [Portunus trituberculatus]|uniref:uncharacterized protein K02A2.6-like n=1 Tax=Portunus trituberculatus TaxID=210409 RepID=UPI001E1D1678|nr:uncharacterized protein K02A2.6-like [Portunus trituberculatus]